MNQISYEIINQMSYKIKNYSIWIINLIHWNNYATIKNLIK